VCLGVLAGACLVSDDAPPEVIATLVLYNVGAAANNAGQAGGGLATVVHTGLAAGFAAYTVAAYA
jgi:hypothetical protein